MTLFAKVNDAAQEALMAFVNSADLSPGMRKWYINLILNKRLEFEKKGMVLVVLRNSDLNTGAGPMMIDKIFRDLIPAIAYVAGETGVQGTRATLNCTSPQKESILDPKWDIGSHRIEPWLLLTTELASQLRTNQTRVAALKKKRQEIDDEIDSLESLSG